MFLLIEAGCIFAKKRFVASQHFRSGNILAGYWLIMSSCKHCSMSGLNKDKKADRIVLLRHRLCIIYLCPPKLYVVPSKLKSCFIAGWSVTSKNTLNIRNTTDVERLFPSALDYFADIFWSLFRNLWNGTRILLTVEIISNLFRFWRRE